MEMNVFDSDWTRDLKDDLEKLIELSAPEIQPTEKIKLTYGERRQVTALFLDMKGFTALSEKFDHEVINNLIDKMFMVFKNQIDRREGWVEKFEGDAILAAFGSKIAHEDDAVRAVDSAMAIMESLRNLKPQLQKRGIEIDIRIGIHSGEVTRSKRAEFDVIVGDTVNTAARLEQNALPGTILVSESTYLLAMNYFFFDEHPSIFAKGKTEPVKAWVVTGKQVPKDRWNRRQLRSRLIGRSSQLDQLVHLFSSLIHTAAKAETDHANQHGVAIIEGDAGIGKSRLMHEFLSSVTPESTLKSTAPAFAGKPFESLANLLSGIFHSESNASIDAPRLEQRISELTSFASDAEELKRSVPFLGFLLGLKNTDPGIQALDPKNLRTALYLAARSLMEAFAQQVFSRLRVPLVLVFDDYHWIDDPSRDFLPFLVTTARTCLPFLIVITSRPPVKLPSFPAEKAQLLTLKLEPLADADSHDMVRDLLGGITVSDVLLEMIQTRGSGNPYYIEELINHWIDRGILSKKDDRWVICESDLIREIPLSLHNLLAARIDHLDTDLKMLLQHVSVIGRDFLLQLIEWVENRLETRIQPASVVNQLITLMFLTHSDALYMFRHILTRDVAYHSLLISNRKILHKLCAMAIEEIHRERIDDFLMTLGEHWLICGECDTALEYFIRAANYARRLYDNKNAIDAYTKAIELLPGESDRLISLHLNRGEVLRLVGLIQDAQADFETSLKIAEKYRNQKMIGNSLNNMGNIQFMLGHPDEAFKYYERALAIRTGCGDELGQATSIHNMGNIHHSQGRTKEAMTNFRNALAIREKHSDPRGIAESSNNIGILHLMQGEYEPAFECFSKSMNAMHDLGDLVAESNAILNIGRIHFIQGDYDEALCFFEKAFHIKRKIGDLYGESQSLNNLGAVHYSKGQFTESLNYYQQSLKLRQALNDKPGMAGSIHNIGTSNYCLGHYDEAIAHFQKSLGLYREIGNRNGEAESLNNIGLIHYEDGRYHNAAEYFKQTLELQNAISARKGASDSLINCGKVDYSLHRYAQALDRYTQAIEIKKELNDVQGIALATIMYGDVRYCLGNIEEALQLYKKSLETFDHLKDKKWKAITLGNIGRIETFRGDYPAALKAFEESLSLRRETGDARGEAYVLNAIGSVCFRMSNLPDAKRYVENSLILKRKLSDRQGIGFSIHLMGDIASCEGNFEPALSFYEEAMKYRSETDQDHMIYLTQSLHARVLFYLNRVDMSFESSRSAVAWFESLNSSFRSHVMEPEQLYFTHYLILHALDHPDAENQLRFVYEHLDARRRMIGDHAFFVHVLHEPMMRLIHACLDSHRKGWFPTSDKEIT